MTETLRFTHFAMALAVAVSITSSAGSAELPTTSRVNVEATDVVLSPHSQFFGRVADLRNGNATPRMVELWQDGRQVATTAVLPNGSFVFQRLKGGCYQLIANGVTSHCRIWSARAAPPCAVREFVVQHDVLESVVRGQGNYRPFPFPRTHRKVMALAALGGLGWGIFELLDDEPGS